MNKILASTFCLFLVVGCGADELNANTNAKTEEVPVTPLGTISGQVLTTDVMPLPEAKVVLTMGGLSLATTTNDAGEFSFVEVPAGSEALVTIEKEGHSTARVRTFVPVDAGGFPLANGNAHIGPIVLVALNTNIDFYVFDAEYRPAVGAKGRLVVNLSNLSFDYADVVSSVASEAVADADGKLTFSKMPDPFSLIEQDNFYTLWISPYDRDGDGVPEYGGIADGANASAFATSSPEQRRVRLDRINDDPGYLRLEVTNIESLNDPYPGSPSAHPAKNFLKQGESIRLVFNDAIEPASVVVRLTDETGSEDMPVSHKLTAGHTLTIDSVQTLTNGAEYNLNVRAVSKNGNSFNSTGFFFVGDRAAPLPLAIKSIEYQETSGVGTSKLDDGETVYVQFNQVLSGDAFVSTSVHAFFNNDIDNDDEIGGNTIGETGNNLGLGFPLSSAEPIAPRRTGPVVPNAVFPLKPSGYTSLFKFTYTSGGGPALESLLPASVTHITIDFDLHRERTSVVYDTAWGEAVSGSYTNKLIELPVVNP